MAPAPAGREASTRTVDDGLAGNVKRSMPNELSSLSLRVLAVLFVLMSQIALADPVDWITARDPTERFSFGRADEASVNHRVDIVGEVLHRAGIRWARSAASRNKDRRNGGLLGAR